MLKAAAGEGRVFCEKLRKGARLRTGVQRHVESAEQGAGVGLLGCAQTSVWMQKALKRQGT
jgi:hypothetical protein